MGVAKSPQCVIPRQRNGGVVCIGIENNTPLGVQVCVYAVGAGAGRTSGRVRVNGAHCAGQALLPFIRMLRVLGVKLAQSAERSARACARSCTTRCCRAIPVRI
jgi:hypothetical protein